MGKGSDLSSELSPTEEKENVVLKGSSSTIAAKIPHFSSGAMRSWLHGSVLQSVLAYALDCISWFLNLLSYERSENFFLSGNFAPVVEASGVERGLKIDGAIPDYVSGEFVRVGPNPKYRPTSGYHWFDGDGMLHGVRVKNGQAAYVNRFVKTFKLQQEDAVGRAVFMKIGELKGWVGLSRMLLDSAREWLGILDASKGFGTANTALVYHGDALLALQEADKPYALKVLEDGDLETLGRTDYNGVLDHAFTAHPKVDPVTGEMFAFGYDVMKAPYCTYRVVNASGYMGPKVPITIPEPVMMHDFAVTDQHAIIMDQPLVFDPSVIVTKGSIPFVWKGEERPSRFGILPRNDTTEANIRWFIRPPCYIFHVANAWEEGNDTVMIGCRNEKVTLSFQHDNFSHTALTEFRFNMKTGQSSETLIADVRCEFPRINDDLACRKQRYVYAVVMDNTVEAVGVVKFDLSRKPKLLPSRLETSAATAAASCLAGGCVVGYFDHGPGRTGSEPVFVPRKGSPASLAEDDGCLLNMVYDSSKNLSEVVIIDAKRMSAKPLAIVHLQSRVPYGFHGIFVSEDQLQKQAK